MIKFLGLDFLYDILLSLLLEKNQGETRLKTYYIRKIYLIEQI